MGSGFSENSLTAGVEGELGCSDVPGWGEGSSPVKQDKTPRSTEQSSSKSGRGTRNDQPTSQTRPRSASQADAALQNDRADATTPSLNDGTDDHLHHPLPESSVSESGPTEKYGDYVQNKPSTHADIQSLQEMAEIQGKVVMLSRGGCGFLEKVKWAQRRGAIAVIVGDNARGGNLVTMYARGDTSNVTIPALFTSYTTAHLLSSLIPEHSGAVAGLGDSFKSTQAKLASQVNSGKQRSTTTKTTTSTPSPTSNHYSVAKDSPAAVAESSGGFFRTLGSLLGLSSHEGASGHLEDSRRPPSSGNIDWMVLGSWDEDENYEGLGGLNHRNRGKADDLSSSGKPGLSSGIVDGDGFVIGVQDWRDPDLMPARSSTPLKPSATTSGKDGSKTSVADKDSISTPNVLRGGSITPGSGEYQSIDKTSSDAHDAAGKSEKHTAVDGESGSSSGKSWFSSHFGWKEDSKPDMQPSSFPSSHSSPMADEVTQGSSRSSSRPSAKSSEHEGLWVTLTPTSMSTSPFFDTLLVLVVSPLLTLTVVYALLLLRSRIRRRRWRAPKSVVERLPVRTYHTISSTSSSSTGSPRPSSPGPFTPTSPLLGNETQPGAFRSPRVRPQTISGTLVSASEPSKEERPTNVQKCSTLWRRKYTGRQVECVVCLEEYIDGQSRVMSLPCGHEFHAECM